MATRVKQVSGRLTNGREMAADPRPYQMGRAICDDMERLGFGGDYESIGWGGTWLIWMDSNEEAVASVWIDAADLPAVQKFLAALPTPAETGRIRSANDTRIGR
jgi:hypothetical protein